VDKGRDEVNKLALVKSEDFHGVQCDFWKGDSDNYFMTLAQLSQALEYASKSAIEKILARNEYLKSTEFSTTYKLSVGGTDKTGVPQTEQETRVFTEDGIYEVTMLAKTDRAKEFRAKVRQILKDLRQGKVKAFKQIDPRLIEAREKNAQARLMNAKRKDAEFLISQVGRLSPQSAELVRINAIEMIAGKGFLPRPKTEKHYTAGDIAKEAGISANMVGKIANANGFKTAEYGCVVLDKSKYSDKQVETFRYNEAGRTAILGAIPKRPYPTTEEMLNTQLTSLI
jgi:prophage antirepressor-like protein